MAGAGPAFLFDLDGTISDAKPGIVRSLRHALERVGHPLAASVDLDWCVGPPMRQSLATLLGSDSALVETALGHYRERYRGEGLYENALYPGMAQALQALAPKARLFVATSKISPFADEIIRHFGLQGLFQRVYGSEPDGSLDDKADLIGFILKTEGLDAGACVMIGDREHDMRGAVRNGIPGLGVLWGYGSEAVLVAAGAKATVKAPSDLPEALRPFV